MDVSVILPCRNEAAALPTVLDEAEQALNKLDIDYEIIVSDSSTDNSPAIARDHDARVVKHDQPGYGKAIKEGAREATGDTLLIADADHTYDFNDAPTLLDNQVDLVIGTRTFTSENMTVTHRIGNTILSTVGNILFNADVHDWHCGMRVIDADLFQQLNLQTDGMEFASEMIIKAARHDVTIAQVPINYRPRIGESKLDSAHDGWKHLRFLILNSPQKTIYPLALPLLALPILADGFALRLTALLAGFQLLTVGLYSEIYLHDFLHVDKPHIELLYELIDLKRGLLLGTLLLLAGIFIQETFIQIAILLLGLQTVTTVYYMSVLGIR